MKKFYSILLVLGLITYGYDNFAQKRDIELPDELKADTETLDVKGRWGWQMNQIIKFGDYYTSKIKKGWITTTHSKFLTDFKKAKQKFSFTQYTPAESSANVNCFGELEQRDIDIIKDFFAYNLEYKYVFSGSIELEKDTVSWNFIVNEPDDNPGETEPMGYIGNSQGDKIEIYATAKLEGKKIPKLFQGQVFGYFFKIDGKTVAAVSIYNKGKIYLSNDLDERQKLVIASISTALLVRSNLEDEGVD